MGLFVPRPKLENGEQLIFKFVANHSRGNRAVGGRVFVTNRRLVFSPNIVDRMTLQKEWHWPSDAIEEVGVADPTTELLFSGGMRRRLRVRLNNGAEELFVVNHVEEVVPRLTEVVSANTSAPPREDQRGEGGEPREMS
jgi:hypothetical protein